MPHLMLQTVVLVHEISHSLGWSHDHFPWMRDAHGKYSHIFKRTHDKTLQKDVAYLAGGATVHNTRKLFKCTHLRGLELEDQGGSGTATSHPERRIFPESYMSGEVNRAADFIVDDVSMSVFQDSGWYQVRVRVRVSDGEGEGE